MDIQKIDTRLRSSLPWRILGITVCLWVAGVIGFAGSSAYKDGVEIYDWTMLGLLLLGLPLAAGAIAYAAVLLGQKGRKLSLLMIIIFCTVMASLQIYNWNQYRIRAEERRTAQLNEDVKTARLAAEREKENAEDWRKFGETCRKDCEKLGDYTESCSIHCSHIRGQKIRMPKFSAAKEYCENKCGNYASKDCMISCLIDRVGPESEGN
jgi:hypothetical protein